MKDLISKHLSKSVGFGIAMTVVGFFNGSRVFTFPRDLLALSCLFVMYSVTFLAINVLFDWLFRNRRKD